MFEVDGFTSTAFEPLAELGQTPSIESEILSAQSDNDVSDFLIAGALWPREDGNTLTFTVDVNSDAPLYHWLQ